MGLKKLWGTSMYTIIIVLLAIAIAVTQFFKDMDQQNTDDARRGHIDSVNVLLQQKSDTIQEMQRMSLVKNEDLINKQAKAIDLQLQLNEYVTGGLNKPMIEIQPLPMMVYPGYERSPNERPDKYKPVKIYVVNNGTVPLRGVVVRISGSLGFEFNDKGLRDLSTFSNSDVPKLSYKEKAPMTLAVNQRELVYSGNYSTWTYSLKYVCDVIWENGFYTKHSQYESQHEYGSFFNLESDLYMVGNKKVDDPDQFFSLKEVK